MTAPNDELLARIRELQEENVQLRSEIQAVHGMIDGVRLSLPEVYDEMSEEDKTRAMGLPCRVQMLVMAVCPLQVRNPK
jgi:hypothetical protein